MNCTRKEVWLQNSLIMPVSAQNNYSQILNLEITFLQLRVHYFYVSLKIYVSLRRRAQESLIFFQIKTGTCELVPLSLYLLTLYVCFIMLCTGVDNFSQYKLTPTIKIWKKYKDTEWFRNWKQTLQKKIKECGLLFRIVTRIVLTFNLQPLEVINNSGRSVNLNFSNHASTQLFSSFVMLPWHNISNIWIKLHCLNLCIKQLSAS